MKTKNWFGGALALSAALSLAMAGGAWAQPRESTYGSASGSYGSGQASGSGSQTYKKQTPPSKSASEGMGVCTPESCPGTAKSQGSGSSGPGKRGGKGKLDKSSSDQ